MPRVSAAARVAKSGNVIPPQRLEQARVRRRSLDEHEHVYFFSRAKKVEPPKKDTSYFLINEAVHSGFREAIDSAVRALAKQMADRAQRIANLVQVADARLEPDEDDIALADEFPIPTIETRLRARALATRILERFADETRASALMPRFEAGGDGGVGLHWRKGQIELLLTVPPQPSERIQFYGDTHSGASVKGYLAESDPIGFLAQWLVEHGLSSREHPGRRTALQMDPTKPS